MSIVASALLTAAICALVGIAATSTAGLAIGVVAGWIVTFASEQFDVKSMYRKAMRI
ncbi:MAG: hypothetical protein PUB09_01550 [Firmicutes bacterium]|nr:hypothetical protein [Bacillota bacterium]